jgi:transcriptional regulator with XRE-family HTH domain
MSQKDLADRLGVDASQVSLLESGRRSVSQATLEKLATELRVPAHLIVFLASGKKHLRRISEQEAQALGAELLRVLIEEFPEDS